MQKTELTAAQRAQRMNVRNFMLCHNAAELGLELANSRDTFRAACVQELIEELQRELQPRQLGAVGSSTMGS